jgi:hypothetical protein
VIAVNANIDTTNDTVVIAGIPEGTYIKELIAGELDNLAAGTAIWYSGETLKTTQISDDTVQVNITSTVELDNGNGSETDTGDESETDTGDESETENQGSETENQGSETDTDNCKNYITVLNNKDNTKHFIDVPDTYWASDSINLLASKEIMLGTSDTTFSPDNDITRGMLVQIIYNLENKPDVDILDIFSDVTTDTWCTEAITWAYENDIIVGYTDGTFGVDDYATREQVATMLYNYAGSPLVDDYEIEFVDTDKVSEYAVNAMKWATNNGIIIGIGNSTLDPRGLATRAQVSTIFTRFLNMLNK